MNIIQLFNDFNIDYETYGKNISNGWIGLQCINPLCNDQSNHLGYNLQGDYFKCWKCGKHSNYQILKWLLPNENIKELIQEYTEHTQIITKLKKEEVKRPNKISLPGNNLQEIHRNYLNKRGYDPKNIINKYKVLGTTFTPIDFQYKLIIPVFYNNRLCTFQARDVTNNVNISRYKNCQKEKEIIPLKHLLYNIDNCINNWIIITEGVFKVWNLDNNNVCATFGKNVTVEQINLLSTYKEAYIFFDPDRPGQDAAKKLALQLDAVNVNTYNIKNNKPPDELTKREVKNFWKKINKNDKNYV